MIRRVFADFASELSPWADWVGDHGLAAGSAPENAPDEVMSDSYAPPPVPEQAPPPLPPENPYAAPQSHANGGAIGGDHLEALLGQVQWPLTMTFKVLALASQITVRDAAGRELIFSRQKIMKFREQLELFTDSGKGTRLGEIRTNKVIDWSARYHFSDAQGQPIGQVGRKGWRSLWKAHYESFNPGDDQPDYAITEENPAAKVFDALLGEVPIVGMLTGFLFHPRYAARDNSGRVVMQLTKKPAFFEGKFEIERLEHLTARQTLNLVLSFLMLVSLERRRG